MNALFNYIKDTKSELKYVSWPTRRQGIMFTIVVIVISLIVALYLGLFDWVFEKLIELFIL